MIDQAAARPTGWFVTRTCSPQPDERCELCAVWLPHDHRHVLDERHGQLMCSCRGCAVLFDRDAAGRGHYRLVPEGRIRLDVDLAPGTVNAPAGLAFFVKRAGGAVVAHYPGPTGTTQAGVDPDGWAALARRCPALAAMDELVQALLVNTAHGADHRWLVPIDDCYRLAAIVRRGWRGRSGGARVWWEVDRFFATLTARPARRGR